MTSHLGFAPHNHRHCVQTQLKRAEQRCRDNGKKLTDVRRRVLELLLRQHQALGAYDLLEVIRQEGLGSQPPAVYRALDFLVTQGLAHKIERLNAFVACCGDDANHNPMFLVCTQCNRIAELPSHQVLSELSSHATQLGFQIQHCTLEIEGLCQDCAA